MMGAFSGFKFNGRDVAKVELSWAISTGYDVPRVPVLPAFLAVYLHDHVSSGDMLLLQHGECPHLHRYCTFTMLFATPNLAMWGGEVFMSVRQDHRDASGVGGDGRGVEGKCQRLHTINVVGVPWAWACHGHAMGNPWGVPPVTHGASNS